MAHIRHKKGKSIWVMKTTSAELRTGWITSTCWTGGLRTWGRTPIDIDESRLTRHARWFIGLVLKTVDGLFDGLDLKTLREGFAGLVFKTRHGRFGGLGLKTIDDEFNQFGPQNGERRTRGCIL